MREKLRSNGLSLVMFALFLLFLVGQSVAGWKEHNRENEENGQPLVGYPTYLTTGHFHEAVFENWESEFLQMAAFVFLTVFLYQRGSAESNDPDAPSSPDEEIEAHRADPKAPSPVRRGGLALKLYSHSLSLAFLAAFLLSLAGHALGGVREVNHERAGKGEPPVALTEYVTSSTFWFQSLQNWQSEFLAIGSMVVLSIWLREKGSSESKKVYEPHDKTGTA